MTQAIVGESCKGLHNALTSAIARGLPLGIARPLRIVRDQGGIRTKMRMGPEYQPVSELVAVQDVKTA